MVVGRILKSTLYLVAMCAMSATSKAWMGTTSFLNQGTFNADHIDNIANSLSNAEIRSFSIRSSGLGVGLDQQCLVYPRPGQCFLEMDCIICNQEDPYREPE